MKVLRVVGARPQFMQVPTVRDALAAHGHKELILNTGQHYDYAMSGGIMEDLQLPPADFNLGVGSGPQGAKTGDMMAGIERVVMEAKPDAVLVDGDTNSTLAAALVAVKLHVPLFHIEGGVRSYDRRQPEEVNRTVTDHCADLNFAPVPEALECLRQERLGGRSMLAGDVLLDCFLRYRALARTAILDREALRPGAYYVLTVHRAENTSDDNGARFREILTGASRLDRPVVFPVHPRSRPFLDQYVAAGGHLGAVRPIPALQYLDMLGLVQNAALCITDSGGLQRESLWCGVPTAVLLEETMWTIFVERQWIYKPAIVADEIADSAARAPEVEAAEVIRHFGGGEASSRIAAAI